MSNEDFKLMLFTLCTPDLDIELRHNILQSLKYFCMSYISGIQGVITSTSESDPIHTQALEALKEIETILMDR